MKIFRLPNVLSLILFSGIIFSSLFVFTSSAFGDTYTPPSKSVTVSAKVGTYYLSLSGYVAPYASVVLTANDLALKSTVADANGFFSIPNVIVNQGFTQFCLDAVDVKRLGESFTCLTIPPITGNYQKNDIFLPPTLGVQRTEVNVGENAVIWGYSMPGASVTVHLSDGRTATATADETGFYEVKVKMVQAGQYQLFADATYHAVSSLKPDRTTTLVALSVAQQVVQVGENIWDKIWKFLFGNPWGMLFVIIPLLILIFLLLRKFFPRLFTVIEEGWERFFEYVPLVPHKLHHAWMDGVGF